MIDNDYCQDQHTISSLRAENEHLKKQLAKLWKREVEILQEHAISEENLERVQRGIDRRRVKELETGLNHVKCIIDALLKGASKP